MSLSLRRGRVSAVVEEVEGLARIEVDGSPCVAYPRLTGPVEVGDEVLIIVAHEHGPRGLWPLSYALRVAVLLLNYVRIRLLFPGEGRDA